MLCMKYILPLLFFTIFSQAWALDEIIFSKKIPRADVRTLKNDFKVFENFFFYKQPKEQSLEVFGLPYFDNQELSYWLRQRIHYIVHPSTLSELDIRFALDDLIQVSSPQAMMSNLGTFLYLEGLKRGRSFELTVKRGIFRKNHQVVITSPKAGVIQLEEGLLKRPSILSPVDKNSLVNSLDRMAILFHEAKHSEGVGPNAGHLHISCPQGHDYEGFYACDKNSQGAYGVGAQMLLEFIRNCDQCSLADIERLKLRYLDSLNRIIN